jgi:pre-mRNA-splicing factor SYF2
MTARDNARLERQRKLAEVLRTQAEAEDRGEDVERQKNWEWTIEENDNWEKKKARKARRADYEFHGRGLCHSSHDDIHHSGVDDVHAARRRYKKDLDLIKPDLVAYSRQKEAVLGLAPGSLSKSGSSTPSSSALTTFDPSGGQASVAESFIVLYILWYTCLRWFHHLNNGWLQRASTEMPILYCMLTTSLLKTPLIEWLARSTESTLMCNLVSTVALTLRRSIDKKGKFSRKRLNEDEGDITYINERNRVFNKKVLSLHIMFLKYELMKSNRLRGTTTNIPPRFGLVSSEEQHCELGPPQLMLFRPLYTCIQTLLTSCNIIKIYTIDALHDVE